MPQLDLSFFKVNIISLLISFFCIYIFVKYILLSSYYKLLQQRRIKIQDNISKAKEIMQMAKKIETTLEEVLSIKKKRFLIATHELFNDLEEINKKSLIKFQNRINLEHLQYIKDFKKNIGKEFLLTKDNIFLLYQEVYCKINKNDQIFDKEAFDNKFNDFLKNYE